MKNSNLVKIFSILLISVMVMMFSTSVLAADDGFSQLALNTNNNTTTNNTSANTTSTDNTNRSTVSTNNTNNTNNGNTNTRNTNTNTNSTNTRNNSSVYNDTNLPKTGIEDSIPVALLVVVFGISAIYAYKKIKDYRNV